MGAEAECNGATHLQCKWYPNCVSRKQMHNTREPWQMYSLLKPGRSINKSSLTVSTQGPGEHDHGGTLCCRGVLPKLTHKQASSTPICGLFSIGLKTGGRSWGRDMEKCSCAGAGGVLCWEDGWKMMHLLAYLAEMAAQNSLIPSVVVCG